MTAAIPAGETSPDGDATGASFHDVTDWHTMNWQKVNHTVRRLQARIVKATKEKQAATTPAVSSPGLNGNGGRVWYLPATMIESA